MYWWGWGWGWVGGLVNAMVWIAIIVVAVMLLRREMPNLRRPGHHSPALRTLEERYARGEITRDEFIQRRAVLMAGAPGPPSPPPPAPGHGPPPGPASEPPGAVARAEQVAGEPTQRLPEAPVVPDEPSEPPA